MPAKNSDTAMHDSLGICGNRRAGRGVHQHTRCWARLEKTRADVVGEHGASWSEMQSVAVPIEQAETRQLGDLVAETLDQYSAVAMFELNRADAFVQEAQTEHHR